MSLFFKVAGCLSPTIGSARDCYVMVETSMLAVVVPAGVTPGVVFQVQTPSGLMMAVTCPQDAAAGSQIQVVVAAPAAPAVADPAWALSALGTSIKGFVFDSPSPLNVERGDGKPSSTFSMSPPPFYVFTATQRVLDLQGNLIAMVNISSNNISTGHLGALIVAADGTTIASVEKPTSKAPYAIHVNGGAYASATIDGPAHNLKYERGMSSGYVSRVSLTRHDGSGGLKVAERRSKKGYFVVLGAVIAVPTLCLGNVVAFQIAHQTPAVHGHTSLDGQRFPPLICQGTTTTCTFASSDSPTAKQKAAKKYIDAHAPSALETASAKLDVLLMLAVSGTAAVMNGPGFSGGATM